MNTPSSQNSQYEDRELQEFLREFFENSESNNGYRYFAKEDIHIYPKSREMIINLDPQKSKHGVPDFASRTQADSEFLHHFSPQMNESFGYENRMFNFGDQSPPEVYQPEVGGRIAITQVSLYSDKTGKTYISMPLSDMSEIYKGQGKLSGGRIIKGSRSKIVKPILSDINPSHLTKQHGEYLPKKETNQIFMMGRGAVKPIADNLNLGEWTVKFRLPNGRFEALKNVHIQRANDGSFEMIKTQMYYSETDLTDNFLPIENIDFSRPVAMVEIDDLLDTNTGGNLPIQKVFFENREVLLHELPQKMQQKFKQNSDKNYVLQKVAYTPPMEFFREKMQANSIISRYRSEVQKVIDTKKEQGKQMRLQGELAELRFADVFHLKKNTEKIQSTLHLPDHASEKIEQSTLSVEAKKRLQDFLKTHTKQEISLFLDPDFIIPLSSGKVIAIEYKTSGHAERAQQKMFVDLYMLFETDAYIEKYITVLGSDENIFQSKGEGMYRVSEKFLVSQNINNLKTLIDFFTKKSPKYHSLRDE